MGVGQRATVLLSGGIDSAACAHFLLHSGLEVGCLFVDYGQGAARAEAAASNAVAEHLSIPIVCVTLSDKQSRGAGELVGRNAMLVFNALLQSRGQVDILAIGIHAGTRYFDCSKAFVATCGRLVEECTDGHTTLVAPFVEWSKRDVFDYFSQTDIPRNLTYSCEASSEKPCGECLSCKDRRILDAC